MDNLEQRIEELEAENAQLKKSIQKMRKSAFANNHLLSICAICKHVDKASNDEPCSKCNQHADAGKWERP